MGFGDRHAGRLGGACLHYNYYVRLRCFLAGSFFVGICRFACIGGSLDSKVVCLDSK